jgi:hypothetical protein
MKRCCEAESTHKAATPKNNDNASKKENARMKVLMQLQHKKITTMDQRKENARMKVLMQPQHKMSTTMHQGREDANVSSRILAQCPMMRKCHMPLNVQ